MSVNQLLDDSVICFVFLSLKYSGVKVSYHYRNKNPDTPFGQES